MTTTVYDDVFFDQQVADALASARALVPVVLDLIRPERVLDVGCGRGAWLRAFKENGVPYLRGLDGPYVEASRLLIEPTEFRPTDLAQPWDLGERFDLAMCLEVGEHLPPSAAPRLVESLCRAAPLVLFSAAIPGQGGTYHVNEQAPGYWQSLFAEHGLRRLDVLRPRIWKDRRIAYWYRQNVVLYATAEALERWDNLRRAADEVGEPDLEFVHKDILNNYITSTTWLPQLLRLIPAAIIGTVRRRFAKAGSDQSLRRGGNPCV